MADELVFVFGLSPTEVMNMRLSDALYWHERGRMHVNEIHARRMAVSQHRGLGR